MGKEALPSPMDADMLQLRSLCEFSCHSLEFNALITLTLKH